MENIESTEKSYSLWYLLSVIFWVATSLVFVCSIGSAIVGAILGLLVATFFVNVLVKNRDEV